MEKDIHEVNIQESKMKKCFRCKKKKSKKEFRKNKFKSDGLDWLCKICRKLKTREDTLKNRHNITLEQYNFLLKNQNGCCAICGIHYTKLKKGLHVDHNHKTGIIRGLLCVTCNGVLGYYKKHQNKFEKYLQTVSQRMIRFYQKLLRELK